MVWPCMCVQSFMTDHLIHRSLYFSFFFLWIEKLRIEKENYIMIVAESNRKQKKKSIWNFIVEPIRDPISESINISLLSIYNQPKEQISFTSQYLMLLLDIYLWINYPNLYNNYPTRLDEIRFLYLKTTMGKTLKVSKYLCKKCRKKKRNENLRK